LKLPKLLCDEGAGKTQSQENQLSCSKAGLPCDHKDTPGFVHGPGLYKAAQGFGAREVINILASASKLVPQLLSVAFASAWTPESIGDQVGCVGVAIIECKHV
jgi:hypothetical protein